jgi:hypothetical protein
MKTEKQKESYKKWQKSHKEKCCEINKKWRNEHPEQVAAAKHKYSQDHKESIRNYHLGYKYGITLEEYNDIFTNQSGNCAICGRNQSTLKKILMVDHDHKTGIVRGLICHHCNFVLGQAFDDPKTLRSAADYLEGGVA